MPIASRIARDPAGRPSCANARPADYRLQISRVDLGDQQRDYQRPGWSSTVQILQAVTAADLVAVYGIMAKAWVSVPAAAPSRLLLPPTLSTQYLLARMGTEPAAAVRLHSGDDVLHLEKLSVLPRFRGSGLTRRLFEAAVAIARVHGVSAVTAEVYARHHWAWQRWGARISGAPGWIDGVPAVPLRFDIRN